MRESKLSFFGVPLNKAATDTGFSYQTLYKFLKGERRISAENAVHFEAVLGIPRETMRPDLWPAGEKAPKARTLEYAD